MSIYPHPLIVISLLLLFACKKPHSNLLDADVVFSSDATARALVNGLYSSLVNRQDFFSDHTLSLFPALLSDELTTTGSHPVRDPFLENDIGILNSIVTNNCWRRAFELIYHTNTCIEGLAQSTRVTPAAKKQLSAEARLVRAYAYFHLVNLFGGVPLIIATDYKINRTLPRSSPAQIYALILSDLQYAAANLAASDTDEFKGRPCKAAAYAWLAKVSLYLSDWKAAETYATLLISSGRYQLDKKLQQVFETGSTEAIWQLGSTADIQIVLQAGTYIPATASSKPPLVLTPSLLQAFEAGDQRKAAWLKSTVFNGQTYYYPYKYRNWNGPVATEGIFICRLAEIYLIRAEARAKQERLEEAVADLNKIRERANLLPLEPPFGIDQILGAITKERRTELFGEWGNRWYDLKRTGAADAVLAPIKGAHWQSTDILLPIPDEERDLNPALEQNPGY